VTAVLDKDYAPSPARPAAAGRESHACGQTRYLAFIGGDLDLRYLRTRLKLPDQLRQFLQTVPYPRNQYLATQHIGYKWRVSFAKPDQDPALGGNILDSQAGFFSVAPAIGA
jgi:hypothetical protein